MKQNIIKWALLLLGVALIAASCDKDYNTDGEDTTSLRVSLTPAPGTIVSEGDVFTAAVVVNQGKKREVPWEVSVDNDPSWVSVTRTTLEKNFTGTYTEDTATYTVEGITVTVSPNTTGNKRMANLRFTVKDGSSIIYTINQAQ